MKLEGIKKNSNLVDTVISLLGVFIAYSAMYLFYFAAAKFLEKKETDILFEALVFVNFVSIIGRVGFDRLSLRLFGSYKDEYPINFKTTYKQLISIPFFFSVLISGLLYFTFTTFNEVALFQQYQKYTSYIFLIPLFTINFVFSQSVRGLRLRLQAFIIHMAIIYGLPLLFLLLNSFYKTTIVQIYHILYISGIISCCYGYFLLESKLSKKSYTLHENISLRDYKSDLMYILLSSLALYFYSGGDIFFINFLIDNQNSSEYLLANKSILIVSIGLVATNNMLAPKVANAYSQKAYKKLSQDFIENAQISSLFSTLICCGLILILDYLLIFLGSDYEIFEYLVLVFMLGQIVNSSVGGVNVVLQMTNNEKSAFQLLMLTILLALPTYYFLIINYGIIGAAIANSLSLVFFNFMLLKKVEKTLRFKLPLWSFARNILIVSLMIVTKYYLGVPNYILILFIFLVLYIGVLDFRNFTLLKGKKIATVK